MAEESNPTDPRDFSFSDSFTWLDISGFEHLTSVRTDSMIGLLQEVSTLTVSILKAGGKPVVRFDRGNGHAPSPSPAGKPKPQMQQMEDGIPAVDAEGNPIMVDLPDDHHLFTVKELYHDTNKDRDRHMLKVVIEEPYEFSNGKWGISYFKPDGPVKGWNKWPLEKRIAPPPEAVYVVVRDPQNGGKFADVIQFLSA